MSQSVKIGEETFDLVLPPSFAVRYDIAIAGAGNQHRAFAAALGACWGNPKTRPRARYGSPFDVADYGGRVLDELVSRGIPPAEILAAGIVAYNLLGESAFAGAEVDEAAEGFPLPAPAGP